jgi:hypothetical protein
MEQLRITINSLEDAKAGKPIDNRTTTENIRPTKDFTVAILEGGMKSGRTSIMFTLGNADGTFSIAEMTPDQFEVLIGAFRGAIERFGK